MPWLWCRENPHRLFTQSIHKGEDLGLGRGGARYSWSGQRVAVVVSTGPIGVRAGGARHWGGGGVPYV